jgi:integrase
MTNASRQRCPRLGIRKVRRLLVTSFSSGANVLVVQRQLGHRSAAITLDVYADLFDTDLDAVAQAFDKKCAQDVPKVSLKAVD